VRGLSFVHVGKPLAARADAQHLFTVLLGFESAVSGFFFLSEQIQRDGIMGERFLACWIGKTRRAASSFLLPFFFFFSGKGLTERYVSCNGGVRVWVAQFRNPWVKPPFFFSPQGDVLLLC